MKATLAIDFDGTIMDPTNVDPGFRMGNPMAEAQEVINYLYKQNYKIIIHTNRGNSPKHVEDWLKFYHIPFDEVTNIKPNADYFIDDKALKFEGDWSKIKAVICQ
jgi:ribonucleotide monophosphatase NagD (HAD superfamily)